MPKPHDGETMDEWMDRCVPMVMDDGSSESQDQAVAMCSQMWRDANKSAGQVSRAYSVLNIKSIDDDRRVFRGVATTPTPDRIGDIIDHKGMRFKNPLPLLWQHKHDAPIGRVTFEQPTAKGTPFEAEIPVIKESGPLKDRVDTAWGEIKHGLVRATSIGFMPIAQPEMNKHGGMTFPEVEIYELSAVTIPMNAEALITQIKSIDASYRKAEGIIDEIPEAPEAATGKQVRVVKLDDKARDRAPFVVREIKRT